MKFQLSIFLVTSVWGLGLAEIGLAQGPCANATTYTYHEVTYNLVELGDDCWFADDLRTENLNTGLVVQESTNHFMDFTNPWSVPRTYEYIDAGSGGHYYDYFALTSDALCPKGWHVPTIDDVNAAALDANFSSAFPNSEGGSWDFDYSTASTGTWAVSTSPSFGALKVFNNAGSASEMGGEKAGGKTRCVKD